MTLIVSLAAALESSSAPAVHFGSRTISRSALAGQAARLQVLLRARGIGPGDRVALLCPNHPAFLVAHLAVLASGAVLVPLNPLYQSLELAPLLQDSSPGLLLCLDLCETLAQAALESLEPDTRPSLLVMHDPGLEPAMAQVLRQSIQTGEFRGVRPAGPAPGRSVTLAAEYVDLTSDEGRLELLDLPPEAPAVMIYTSGTTGTAKAAVLSHRNLEHNARFIAREWLGGEAGLPGHADPGAPHRTLAALPLCHNFGLNVTLDATLLHGGTLVLLPRFSAVEALRAIDAHRVSFLPLVPTMTQALLSNPELDRVDVSSVRLLVSGGAALPGPLRERAESRFPGVAMRDTYGLSEASLVCCTRPGGSSRAGTVGQAVDDTEVRVVDPAGRDCPPGEVGEIRVRGPGVMADYWRRPPDAAPSIVDGWLTTGDLGCLDENGDLTIVDRKKDLIIRGGYKVYPLEVEEVLYQHPAVAEAAVYGLPDPRMGERVVACVAPLPGVTLEPRALLAHCRQWLAEFKVPSSIEVRDALPRGSTGKILRRLLRDEATARSSSRA